MGTATGAAYRQTYSRPSNRDRANLPGAGGLVAGNFIYGLAKPDGLTIGAFNPALYFEQLVGKPESKFDWANFSWIGSPERNDALHYIRADSPYKTIDDLRNAKEPRQCGSTGGGTTAHYFPRLLEDTLGIKTTDRHRLPRRIRNRPRHRTQ